MTKEERVKDELKCLFPESVVKQNRENPKSKLVILNPKILLNYNPALETIKTGVVTGYCPFKSKFKSPAKSTLGYFEWNQTLERKLRNNSKEVGSVILGNATRLINLHNPYDMEELIMRQIQNYYNTVYSNRVGYDKGNDEMRDIANRLALNKLNKLQGRLKQFMQQKAGY